ncbi:glycoprotease family-domain-containing protein [Halteromyces radiatus]|uniref:glycoprotease family-domain-containing protein n=1 Tax=Halteromyces radiatus TaxID=101107 RepID=UPI00221E9CC8|nr:glycoprotease family-domain-containing protein [Halteromyces radiatus]KAI8093286.1 glycoprotease family-domain-containing protein [Halteromyces radiatus]
MFIKGLKLLKRPCFYTLTQRRLLITTSVNKRNNDALLTVLGIETSCDDTSAAVVRSDRTILSEVVKGQQNLHEPMGGVVPTLASKGHSEQLPLVICQALEQAQVTVEDLDAIAVTRGPGLPPCLPVGLNAAKTLAAVHRKPLIGVHHMEAHALTARMTTTEDKNNILSPAFPFMTLLISGGHTLLLTVNDIGDYNALATTLDNAVGEAIDKTARALDLAWIKGRRGGPGAALERAALNGSSDRYAPLLPMPMLQRNKTTMAFSFSGLKTAVIRLIEKDNVLADPQRIADMAAAFQTVCMRHIEQKLSLAMDHEINKLGKPITALVVSGGVASNQFFRTRLETLARSFDLPLVCPPPHLCTDNGAMIAWAGIERLQAGLVDDYTITTLPRWPIESLKSHPSSL